MRPTALASLLAILLLAGPLGVTVQAQGRLELLNARGEVTGLTQVTVVRETLDEVTFRRGNRSRSETRPTADILAVTYGRGSDSFEAARSALAEGDAEAAARLFAAAVADAEPPWVAAVARLREAEALADRGPDHLEDALGAVRLFLSDHADHRLLPEARLLEARIATALGRSGDADAAFSAVLGLAQAGRIGADWSVRAQLAKGQALLDADDASGARSAFQAAETAADGARESLADRPSLLADVERMALAARSGSGAALLASGDVSGARRFFEDLARSAGDDLALRSAAFNGLAEADFSDPSTMKDAQLGFARVAVLGAGVPDEHAKALYFLGRCAEELGLQGHEANGPARARMYFQEVSKRYPGTRWARLAQQSTP